MSYSYYKIGPNVVNGHTFTASDRYNFHDAKILGRGSFGVVTTAIDTESSKVIAIKRIRPYANDDWDARHTLREIRLMRFLGSHPNVISLYNLSSFDEKSELYMMMELMDCDLHRVIQSKQTLTPKHFKCFVKQILEGIKAMHEVGVFHRDLKPGNILVSKDCQIRITDFGLARFMDETTRQGNNKVNPMTEYVVTRWYRAPELLLCPNSPYDEAIDLWSIGCILAELYRRKPLFPGKSHAHQVQMIFEVMGYNSNEPIGFNITTEAVGFLEKRCIYRKQPITNVVPGLSEDALSLIEDLLSVNPVKRPTAAQALRARYFDDADVICDYTKRYVTKPTAKDFEFEQAKFSLDELRGMILEEVRYYESLSSTKVRKNSGSGTYSIPIGPSGGIDAFSTANSRKSSISGSIAGDNSSRCSWDNMSGFSGKSEGSAREEEGSFSQMQTMRHQPQQPGAYSNRSYIPTDKLLDKLSALKLSGNPDPRPLPSGNSNASLSNSTAASHHSSTGIAAGPHHTSSVPDTDDVYASMESHTKAQSDSRRGSVKGLSSNLGASSIIATARQMNTSSPNPRTPKTPSAPSPSTQAVAVNKTSKYARNSNATSSSSVHPSNMNAATPGSNHNDSSLSRSYNSKSSLAAAGAAMMNSDMHARNLDSRTAAPSNTSSSYSSTRKSSGDFNSIFSNLQSYSSKVGTSTNSSDDDLSETSESVLERKVTTAPDSRRSSGIIPHNDALGDQPQQRMKSFLGLASFGSNAKRF